VRVLGVDVGERRVGLAISDRSRTLARPLTTVKVNDAADAVDRVAQAIATLAADEDGLDAIVVGLPKRLDGSPTTATPRVQAFIDALRARTTVRIVTEGEQLSSREAESRLSINERDWRKRKQKLDAAAAAIILQDYLDRDHKGHKG
jgi:putative Holliday junction resolvase